MNLKSTQIMNEEILAVSSINISKKHSELANKILVDWIKHHKKNTNDLKKLEDDYNSYMTQNWWKVKFELKYNHDLETTFTSAKIELDTLKNQIIPESTSIYKTKIVPSKFYSQSDTNNIPTPKLKKLANREPQNINDIKLLNEELQIVNKVSQLKKLSPEQKNQIYISALAMKANNILITSDRLMALIAIWLQESWLQVDSQKSNKQINAILSSIESKIQNIKYIINDNWDKYFDKKFQEIKSQFKSSKSTSQYDLYLAMQKIAHDCKNKPEIKKSLEELNSWYKSSLFETAISLAWYKKLPKESNSDFVIRMVSSKPSSFGKYEINPDLLSNRIKDSWDNGPITSKLYPKWKFDKLWLIKSMQGQEWWILTQLELEYIYQKYYFADWLRDLNDDSNYNKERIIFMWIDHNAWLFASRNAAIQKALNKKLQIRLNIDWDLSSYDRSWKPMLLWNTYEKIKQYASKNWFTEQQTNDFILKSRSKELEDTDLYNHIIKWLPKYASIDGNNYGKQVQTKYLS